MTSVLIDFFKGLYPNRFDAKTTGVEVRKGA